MTGRTFGHLSYQVITTAQLRLLRELPADHAHHVPSGEEPRFGDVEFARAQLRLSTAEEREAKRRPNLVSLVA